MPTSNNIWSKKITGHCIWGQHCKGFRNCLLVSQWNGSIASFANLLPIFAKVQPMSTLCFRNVWLKNCFIWSSQMFFRMESISSMVTDQANNSMHWWSKPLAFKFPLTRCKYLLLADCSILFAQRKILCWQWCSKQWKFWLSYNTMKTFLHLFKCWLSSKMPKMLENVSGMNQTTNVLCLPLTFCVHWYTTRTNQMSKHWFLGKCETFWRSVAMVLEKCVTAACLLLVSKPVFNGYWTFFKLGKLCLLKSSLHGWSYCFTCHNVIESMLHVLFLVVGGVRHVSNSNISYKAVVFFFLGGGFIIFFICILVFLSLFAWLHI